MQTYLLPSLLPSLMLPPPPTPNALAPSTSTSSHTPHSVHAVNIVLAVLTAIQAGPPTTSISTPISAPCSSKNTFAQQQPPTGSIQPAIVKAPQDPRSLEPLNFCWGEHSGQAIFDVINSSYEEVIHWKPNLFLVPFGSAGTSFVKELARLFQAFAEG